MNTSELVYATSRPYASRLVSSFIFDILFASKQLSFNMQAQTQSNWCWAATSTSVSHFYWLWSTWTQCKVANAELELNTCCNASVPSACNVPWYLDKALTRTNNFVSIMGGQASFQQVRDEIDAGRPVGARIGWSGGGGHFMVIYGYSLVAGTQYFDIDDPIYGKSHLTVSDFASNYQGSGTWTHTYFTKSYFKLPIRFWIPKDLVLQRIWEIRPLMDLKQEARIPADLRAPRGGEQASLGIAQRIYSVGLNSLLGEESIGYDLVGLRVYEIVDETPRAFFDVTEGDEPRVLQMSSSKNHLEPFARALPQALEVVERDSREREGGSRGRKKGDRDEEAEQAELRLFRVPALNFEALWVSYEGEKQDTLIPLHPVGGLATGNPVPFDEAMRVLREAARPLADMDDTMGA